MATTLSQFYSDKGQALPSVSQRGSLAAQAGIQGYSGTAAQNNQLLNFMQTSGTGQTGTQNLQSIQPPVIPAATALGNTKPVQLPTAPQGTASTELGGASAGYLAMPTINSLNQLGSATQTANQNAQTAQNDYMSQFTGLLNQMQNRPGELEKQYQIQQLSQDAMKAKANYDSVELAYRRKKENLMNDASLTSDQKSAVIGDIDRKEASQKADIAIDYNLKAGLLSNAKELMNKQLELELEPMKLKVDFYKDNRDRFDKILDKTEMRQYDYIQKKEEQAYQAAQQNAKMVNDLKMEAIKNGASYDQVKGIKSIADYAKLQGQNSIVTPKGTDAQFTSAAYANRMEQAQTVFNKVLPNIKNANPVTFKAQLLLPSYLQPPEVQEFAQATKNFITAQLRKESGAAISPEEFKTAYAQYIPAPGDSPEVLKQKEQNRLLNTKTLINAAGTAYVPLQEEFKATSTNTGTTPSGITWKVIP